ncbi:glycosyltransferase family 2 protein [Candidatus Woesearchaeota archaeon]|nr:glycosyltransferase family 2 protein [Candidatus Woesearchaeota archaeon]
MVKLSIIIPAHNEEKRIKETLISYTKFFNLKLKNDYELIVIPNACKDKTVELVKEFSKKHSTLKYKELIPGGKGLALVEGFKIAKGNFIGFIDADNSTSSDEFHKLMQIINGYDGAIASRWMKESIVDVKQPVLRLIAGRVFNFIVRFLLGMRFQDTQCGAKLFKNEAIKNIYPKLGITKWAFDIDLIYLMKRNNYKIKEIPIRWRDTIGSQLNIPRASFEMFLALIRLRLIYSPFSFIVKAYDLLPEFIKIHHKL